MKRTEDVRKLLEKAETFGLDNAKVLKKYTPEELACIYNGIGPAAFPQWLRDLISALHPTLAPAALIHDVEFHETDKSKEGFEGANERFKENGYKCAKAEFAWYDPRRYAVMNQARRFGNYCRLFGWAAWDAECSCALCSPR